MSYIQLTSPLVLHADPVLPGHAVTKRYVDSKKEFLQASWFTSGVISAARVPALSGDVTSDAGSGIVTLNTTGVTAGAYTKVTVGSSGRVTSGGYLIASDIPSVDWSKITSGKPTTAAGYGINNLIALSGGVVSGGILSTATPTDNLHAVTKAYVDNNVTGVVSASLEVGDVVRKTTSVTPSGFLRCNGGEVSKATYAALYSVVGDKYIVSNTQPGSGKPWKQQYDINTDGTLGEWTTSGPLPFTIADSQAIVTKNRVYLLGGRINGFVSSTVYTAPINPDGSPGTWTTSTSLPNAVYLSQAIVTKNRVYLLGGRTSTGTLSGTIYTAPINPDGTLGTWTLPTFLPAAVSNSQAFVTKNRVYLLGGIISGAYNSTVYTAPINPDGTLGDWTTSTSLPVGVDRPQVIVTKNRVYLLGGYVNASTSSTVYTAPINQDGTLGGWSNAASLPGGLHSSQAIVTKNYVYLMGGVNSYYPTSVTYTAPVNADGTLGSWTTSTSTPGILYASQAIVTKYRAYLLGGMDINTVTSTVYSALISGGLNDYSPYYDGTIQPFGPVDTFQLPDYTAKETNGINFYIKY